MEEEEEEEDGQRARLSVAAHAKGRRRHHHHHASQPSPVSSSSRVKLACIAEALGAARCEEQIPECSTGSGWPLPATVKMALGRAGGATMRPLVKADR
eukprot:COSAG01_NODE_23525_length_812_cov_0.684432_2_plen_98_part_00